MARGARQAKQARHTPPGNPQMTMTPTQPAVPVAPADELAQLTAPEEFRRAIVKDPYASIYRFDFDAARGATPIDASTLPVGDDVVPRSGYYFDIDGLVVDYYRAGLRFPKLAAVDGAGGRFLFVTDRRDATISDLLWIILRRGWEGNVLEIHVR